MAASIQLDGKTLEGGGQLLRLALSLSSLTRKPVNVSDIRGRRGPISKPGHDGGMKPAHLAGAAWLAKATMAATEGLELKSRDLDFRPSQVHSSEEADSEPDAAWRDVREAGRLVRREARIAISSPGSVLLILQAILPYILFSSPAASSAGNGVVPFRLILEGGTNVWHSLSYEYADQVLFPMLHQKLGLGPISMKLTKRGWSSGRPSIGRVELDITPMKCGKTLPAFEYTDRGEIVSFHVSILAPDNRFRAGIRSLATRQLLRRWPDVDINFPVDDFSGHPKRLYLLIVAESSNGYRLGRDWLYDERISADKPEKAIEALVAKVVRDLEYEISHGGCVDEWLQDQLVVFQALADGESIIDGREPSLHTKTAQWVAEQILGVEFSKQGHCSGIAFQAGSLSSEGSVEEIIGSLEAL